MEYVFRMIHVPAAVPMGKHASTEYVHQMIRAQTASKIKFVLTEYVCRMILVQTVFQIKVVSTEHVCLIPVMSVDRMKYVLMESADRPEMMRASDKLNLLTVN